MKKFWAILCTTAFGLFWVFGLLTLLAWLDAHPLMPHVMVLSLLGLGAGIWSRLRLIEATRDLQRGERVIQAEV